MANKPDNKSNDGKSSKNMRYSLVRTSINNLDMARILAHHAVDLGLAASIHIREVESVYAWESKIFDHIEYEIEFMTTAPRVPELVAFIMKYHPYDCPEIIKIGYQTLNDDFTTWVNWQCRPR